MQDRKTEEQEWSMGGKYKARKWGTKFRDWKMQDQTLASRHLLFYVD